MRSRPILLTSLVLALLAACARRPVVIRSPEGKPIGFSEPQPKPLREGSLRWPLDLKVQAPPKHALPFYPEALTLAARRHIDKALLPRLQDLYGYVAERRVLAPADPVAILLGDQQKLYLLCEDRGTLWVEGTFMVSTGKKGWTNAPVTDYYTPVGLHVIYDKHGHGLPEGTLMQARLSTGRVVTVSAKASEPVGASVTTRVLWLSGREPRNHDSYEANIYLHGTTREYSLGGADSTGCIRLRNNAAVELFSKMPLSAPIFIDPGPGKWPK